MKHLVNVSGGAASGLCLIRVVERFGVDAVSASLADTLNEASDVYAFVDELEVYCGLAITRLTKGESVYQIFERLGMWTNPQSGGCVASHHLKKIPLREHADSIGSPKSTIIYVGFGFDEDDRMDRLIKAAHPWRIEFPLTWKPRLGRCDIVDELKSRGLNPPLAYEQGYPHANCRQACVLAGIGQWQKLSVDDPATYAEAEAHEERMMANMAAKGRKVCTILRDRRGGETRNITLKQLREETQSGQRPMGNLRDAQSCSCVGHLWG